MATLTPNNTSLMLVRGFTSLMHFNSFCSFHSWYSFHSCHKGSPFTREMILDPSRQLGRVGARHAHAYCVINMSVVNVYVDLMEYNVHIVKKIINKSKKKDKRQNMLEVSANIPRTFPHPFPQ